MMQLELSRRKFLSVSAKAALITLPLPTLLTPEVGITPDIVQIGASVVGPLLLRTEPDPDAAPLELLTISRVNEPTTVDNDLFSTAFTFRLGSVKPMEIVMRGYADDRVKDALVSQQPVRVCIPLPYRGQAFQTFFIGDFLISGMEGIA